MKVTICFGLDNCSTAHLESPAKRQKKKKIQLTRIFCFESRNSSPSQSKEIEAVMEVVAEQGNHSVVVPASLKHTNSGSSRVLSIGNTPYPRNWATESIGGSWT